MGVLLLTLACGTSGAPSDSGGGAGVDTGGADTADTACDAPEVCNGEDDDCDGVVDPDGAAGCTDRWPDLDGDGLGGGDPACRCDPDGVGVGGDCDDTDADRGVDCTEGDAAPLAGDRLLHDDPDDYHNVTDVGAVGTAGEVGLLLWAPGASLRVADVPVGDVPLSAATRAVFAYPSEVARPVVGDLDGDGLTDLLSWSGERLLLGDGDCHYRPALTMWAGPLVEAPGPAWTVEPDPVRLTGCEVTLSAFVADLDGSAGAEGWVQVGTPVGVAGAGRVWRSGPDGALEVLEVRDGEPGHLALAAVPDLDGDGFADLVRTLGTASSTTAAVHVGPLATLPAAVDADVRLDGAEPDASVRGLPDLDGDGAAELAITTRSRVWLLGGAASGDVPAVAWARVGSETDGAGNLAATSADLGDGDRLVVADTFFPSSSGPGNLRGAVYLFTTPPAGVVDARAADLRVVGEEYGAFGSFVTSLGDGRLVAGANVQATDVGTGVTWVFFAGP